MSFLPQVGVLVLTFNEEVNLARTLAALSAFPSVVVLDSGSTDETRAIAERHPNVQVRVRAFDRFDAQCNYGLTACGNDEPWVLSLDADHVLDRALVDEIAALAPPADVSGYRVGVRYCIDGRPLSGSLYPPRTVLFRRARGRYVQQGHAHRLVLDGAVRDLAASIAHDDRKPLAHWLGTQQRYAALEAAYLLATPPARLKRTARIRRLGWPAPLLVFAYTLVVKRCLLDGAAGWFYVLQRTLAEIMIALELLDRRRAGRLDKSGG